MIASSSPAVPAAQLTRIELLQLKWLLGGLLTLLSASTVLYLDLNAGPLLAALVVAVAAATWRPAWLARVPRAVHRLAFPFIVAFFTCDLWLTGELLPATVRLDLLLLLYRGITYRQRRDDLQVIVLGLFLIVLAGVLTVSLAFAVQILAFTAGTLAFLLTVTLTQPTGTGADGSEPAADRAAPVWARQVAWGRLLARVRAVTRWRVVAFGAVLFVGLVAVSGMLFVAIPRFQLENSFFLERFVSRQARTGFSDTIRFGEVTQITQDKAVAVSVDVSDRSRIPVAPYWRMLLLDEYHDGTFRMSTLVRRSLGAGHSGSVVPGGVSGRPAADVNWTFYLESGVSRFLPLLGPFGVLRFREPQNYQHARRLGIVATRAEPVSMLAYRVEGMLPGTRWPDPDFAARLRDQRDHPRSAAALMLRVGLTEQDRAVLQRVVADITGGRSLGAAEFAERASEWLGRRHAYSLEPRIPAGNGDPLVRWLESTEGGHCELFAGSLVVLARSAGVPARVVTGFRGGSWNGYSNNFTLRNSDAHAWCEVFDADAAAWVRADPTPGAAAAANEEQRGDALARRLDRSWTARLESLRVFWYRRIVSFDQRSQIDTVNAVKDATADAGRRLRAALSRLGLRVQAWAQAPWGGRRLGTWAGAIALVLAATWAARRFRFGLLAGLGARRRRGDTVRREAGRWLARFSRGQPPSGRDAEAQQVVADLQRLRFGPRETWRSPAEIFRRAKRVWRRRAVG